jgi:hypothetical protein
MVFDVDVPHVDADEHGHADTERGPLSEDYHKINQDSASAQNHVSTRTWFLRRVYTRRATLPSEKDEDSGDGQGQEEDWGGEAQ